MTTQIVRKPKLSQERKNWAKNRNVYLQGLPLHYSAALRARYEKKLRTLVMIMVAETKRSIARLFNSSLANDYFDKQESLATMDASISNSAKVLMNKLTKKFTDLFAGKATELANDMLNDADNASKVALKSSLKKLTGGLTLKTNFIPTGLKETIISSIGENVSLIKSIPEKYFTDVTGSVMRSITTGQGIKDLIPQIEKYDGITERRAKNIALDQTRKAYNTINKQRMMTAGFKKFKWLHSGGGQHPRKDHIAMNGNVYSFDDLPVINKKTGEKGIPGQAINCFLGNTEISLANGCRNLWRYFHDGEIAVISLNSGEVVECTLNHPILTLRGWLPANEIQDNDYLLCGQPDNTDVINAENADIVSTFDDLFSSISISNRNTSIGSEFNFHGDIPKNDVDSIRFDNILPYRREAISTEQLEKLCFSLSNAISNDLIFRLNSEVLQAGSAGSSGNTFSFLYAELGISSFISQGSISEDNSILFQNFGNYLSANRVTLSQIKDAFAFVISFENFSSFRIDVISLLDNRKNIVESFLESGRESSLLGFIDFAKLSKAHARVKFLHRVNKKFVRIFQGHVYTMETNTGWFTVSQSRIISKNCGCTMQPVYEFEDGTTS